MKKIQHLLASSVLWSLVAFVVIFAPSQSKAQCPVNAAFTSSEVYVCLGSTVTFTNTTTGGATFYGWFENSVGIGSTTNITRTFNTPGQYLISLIATNGSCQDTANTIVVVDPDVTGSASVTNASCFGYSDGAINLTPGGGTPNIAYYNDRAATNWSAINSVSQSNFGSGLTIACWAKPNLSWTLSDGMLVSFCNSTAVNRFLFGYNAAQQKFVYFDDVAGNRFQSGIAARGQWHHVVLTMSSTKTINMYVNGVNVLTYTTAGTCIPVIGDFVSIGQEFDGGFALSQHFDGAIDELSIWNTPITGPTATALFNTCGPITSAHPNYNSLVAYYSMNEGSGTSLFDRSGRNNHGTRVIGTTWTTAALTNYGCFYPATGYAYNWGGGVTTEDRTGLAAGSYSVTITDGVGCTETVSATVGEPAPVVVTVSQNPNDSICAGQSTVLTANGANTYAWSPSATLSAGTGTSVTATPSSTTTYTITGTDGTGCMGTTTQTVTVLPLPTAVISGNDVICNGDSTTLTASGGSGYVWNTGSTTSVVTLNPSTTTTYTVTVTDIYGCQDTETLGVTVNALPTVAFAGTTTLCAGDSSTLTASGGTSFSWSNGASTASTTVTPGSSTTYTVTITDANFCSNTDSITVTVNQLPVIAFSGSQSICIGSSTTIMASGGGGYVWSTWDTTSSVTVSPTVNTTYTVVVTDSNICSSTDSVAVTVMPLPVVVATGGDTICFGDSLTLAASGASSYLWNIGATTATIVVFPPNSGFYSVVGTDSNGCSSADSVEVVVNAPPAISISGPSAICEGSSANFIASGGTTYDWSTGDNTSSIVVTPSAGSYTYVVTVTNTEGCTNTGTISLTVNASPTAVISGADSVCVGGSINLTASGGTTYSWSNGGNTATIAITPATSTNYSVTVTDGGCTDTTSHFVTVNPLPATPTITQSGNTLSAPGGFATYQWFLNGNPIVGASDSTYEATVTGIYTVQVTDGNACSSISANYDFTFVGVAGQLEFLNQASVFPNPNNGQFTVILQLDKARDINLTVMDMFGKTVYTASEKSVAGSKQFDIELQDIAQGVYFLQIRSGEASVVKKVVVE